MSDTPSVPIWKTEFQKRIAAFAKALRLEESKVLEVLAAIGVDGENDQSLEFLDDDEQLKFGDLMTVFVDTGLTKIVPLRGAVKHLRGATNLAKPAPTTGNGDVAGAIREMVAANRPKSLWKERELLEAYDESEPEIAKILGEKSRGRPFVVFDKDGSVNVEVSLKLLGIAKNQHMAESHQLDDGRHVIVYRAGIFLAQPLDESPFYPGSALVDGYCAKSSTQWNGVSQKNRVLVRLHANQIETARLSKIEMSRICQEAKGPSFEDTYSEAVALYDDLEAQDNLPKLKILPSEVKQQAGKVDLGV